VAVDRRHRGTRQFCQSLVDVLAKPDPVAGHALCLDLLEALDVRARDESSGLAGANDDALGKVQGDAFDHGREFVHHLAGKCVDVFVCPVEREDEDAIVAAVVFPVEQAKTIEHWRFHT